MRNNQCVINIVCPIYSTLNNNNNCVCNSGYTFRNSQCVPIIICPAYASLSNNKCVCNRGYIMNGINQCIYNNCSINSSPVFNGNSLSCVCKSGYLKNSYNDQCVYNNCPSNSNPTFTQSGLTCICITGYKLYNGQCIIDNIAQCPARSTFNPAKSRC